MPLEIQTALISAAVAIITVAIGGFLTWNQIQRERRRWLTDLKTAYSMELHKTRLDSYPRVYEILKNYLPLRIELIQSPLRKQSKLLKNSTIGFTPLVACVQKLLHAAFY